MWEELDRAEAAKAVSQALCALPACKNLSPALVEEIAARAIDVDLGYMEKADVFSGEAYDEDEAYAALCKGLSAAFPKLSGLDSLMDDYMEAFEIYLDSIGAIAWDGE